MQGETAMIHPTCAEVLATVQTAFDEQVVPHLADSEAQSAAATIGHLLRHVALRIELEGQILSDDIARLEALLTGIADWFDAAGTTGSQPLREALEQRLPAGQYPSLALLGDRSLALRGALVAAQEALHGQASSHGTDPGYKALRERIRDYIAAQLADEGRMIAPAFQGKGPRR
jgi:hypothetical protein